MGLIDHVDVKNLEGRMKGKSMEATPVQRYEFGDAILRHNMTTEETKLAAAEGIRAKYAEGKKYDQGKTRWDLVPWDAVEPLADILTFGAGKYGDNSWQCVENAVERYKAALFRHLIAWCKGEKKDPESGRSHLHHALTNIVFLIWFEMHGQFQKSGFKDDEEYMTTEQKPVEDMNSVISRGSVWVSKDDVSPAVWLSVCKSCSNYGACTISVMVKTKSNQFYCPSKRVLGDVQPINRRKLLEKEEVSSEILTQICSVCRHQNTCVKATLAQRTDGAIMCLTTGAVAYPITEKENSINIEPSPLFVEVARSILKVADVNRFCSSCTNCEAKSRSDRRYSCRLSCRYIYLNKKDNTLYCPQRDLTHDAH